MSGLNQGLLGQNTGTPASWNGYLYHEAMTRGVAASSPEPTRYACTQGQVAWHSEGACFTPTQVHINILELSLVLNVVVTLFIVRLAFRRVRR